jgi:hypothetical protein
VIVCVAGRNELDETAASFLVHLLRLRRDVGEVQMLPADALGSGKLYFPALRSADLVCLSLVSTSSPARARYLVRRTRRRAPAAKVMVGFLGSATPELPSAEAAVTTSADAVASSLGDAIGQIDSLLGTKDFAARAG